MNARLIKTLQIGSFVIYFMTGYVNAEHIDSVNVHDPAIAENVVRACKGDRIVDQKMCLGYLRGVLDVFLVVHSDLINSVKDEAANTPYERLCIPVWVDLESLKKIFFKYVNDNPDMSRSPAPRVAYLAVKNAFPCRE